ncbi:MAG: MBL fold metallo-hydrolase [Synechococcaceae cyanobacterium RL_1_2]|nr:MBL fold metallo-hydrolase [Synechococcaceae cyanobacterium RL_1_2]
MELTWLDSNSWLIEMGNKRILLDPWLVGPLTFGNAPWFFQLDRPVPRPIPDKIDLILLSQGLEDHAHRPTLQELDHSLPVVASPNGSQVVTALGYGNVTTLNHGQNYTFDHGITITAVPGAIVGPGAKENGYILTDLETNEKIYYEPHGFHDPSLQTQGPINVLITPIVGAKLAFVIPVLQGGKKALQACQWLQPQAIIPTAGLGSGTYSGVLAKVLTEDGSIDGFKALLHQANLDTTVIVPTPGEPFQPLNPKLVP